MYRNTLSSRIVKADRDRVALRVVHYDSIRQYCGSDHKPVRAIAHISATAFAEKNKFLQSRIKHRVSKRDSQSAITKMQKSPVVRTTQEEGSSTDNVVADSQTPRYISRSYHIDPSLCLSRQLTVQFEAIRDWKVERNHTVFFRVVDNRNNRTVGADYPGLFQVLSNWDWIGELICIVQLQCLSYFFLLGLYKEDFHSLDNYVTFAYPRFGETVEEAEDALALLHDDTEDQHDHQEHSPSEASTRRGSASSLSSLSQSTSSTAYLSSNELSDGNTVSATPGPSSVSPLTAENQTQSLLESTEMEQLKNLNITHPSTSSSKPTTNNTSTEETDDSKKAKQSSPVSSVSSGSGDQTDSDGSHSPSVSFTSSASASQPALSSTTTTTTTSTSMTSAGHSSTGAYEFSAMFDDQSFLFSSGRYVLIYRRKNGDVLGISEPFEISVDLNEEQPPSTENDAD